MAVARKGRAGIVTPGRVPTLPVEIDWSHPLANGLVACYVPGGARGIVDLAGNGPPLAMGSGAIVGPGSTGAALVNTAANAGASSSDVPGIWRLASAGTLFVSADFLASPSVGNGILWALNHTSVNVTPFVDYSLFVTLPGGKSAFAWNSAGAANSLTSTTSAPTSGKHSLAASFVVGATISIYQDAVPVASGAWSGAGPSYSTPVAMLGANISATTRISNTAISVALTYNRALSAAEIAILDADPFCMLRPMRRSVFKASASSALALTSRGAASSRGLSALALSQSLTSFGAAYSHGSGALSLFAGLALAGNGSARSQGRGTLSLNMALASVASARAHGQGVLLLTAPLAGRGAAFSRGSGALTLLAPLALQGTGSSRSVGRSSLSLLLPLTARGASVGRGRGVLTITGTSLALTALGSARAHGRDSIALVVIAPLHAKGQAFAHGGALRGGRDGIGVLTLTPFIPAQNVINIGMPQRGLPIADPKTGQMNQNWYLFFHALWQRGGGPIGN